MRQHVRLWEDPLRRILAPFPICGQANTYASRVLVPGVELPEDVTCKRCRKLWPTLAPAIMLVLPRLAGTRAAAIELTAALPQDLAGAVVRVQAADVVSAAQGFVDELCVQLLEVRRASGIVLSDPPDRVASYAELSARLRGFGEVVVVEGVRV